MDDTFSRVVAPGRFGIDLLRIAVAGVMLAALGNAGAARVFLSTFAFEGGATPSNPEITLRPSESATLHIYFELGAADNFYRSISLDVNTSLPGLVSATSFNVLNPVITVASNPINDRWNGTGGSLSSGPTLVSNLNGVNVDEAGLDRTNVGPVFVDEGYDAMAGAFYFGSVTLLAGSALGTTDLSLAVGSLLIVREGDVAPGTFATVEFGDMDPPGVSGLVAGATGAVADATIIVIPEPGSNVLLALALGGLALTRNRPKRRWPPGKD